MVRYCPEERILCSCHLIKKKKLLTPRRQHEKMQKYKRKEKEGAVWSRSNLDKQCMSE